VTHDQREEWTVEMKSGRASRTAEHNALFRTLEASVPERQRLFVDPYARRFLTWPLSLVGGLAVLPGGGRLARRVIDQRWPGMRASVVARTRLIDDTLCSLSNQERGQLVILGAGFDSRPYRLDCVRNVPIFEVDHPDTQGVKRRLLARALPALPPNVSFIPTDFNLHQLGPAMEASGFSRTLPTVFLWEGVTNYLTEDAVDATLRWCAQAVDRGILLFTYVHSDVLTHPEMFVGAQRMHATLAKVDELLTFGMDPAVMGPYLAQRGLDRQWDLGAEEYRGRYFGARAEAMVGHEFYRVVMARLHTDTPSAQLGDDGGGESACMAHLLCPECGAALDGSSHATDCRAEASH
jgi:methyltransferase (TIGR00027 family)